MSPVKQVKHGIASLWIDRNPVLASGEFGFESRLAAIEGRLDAHGA